MSDTFDHKYESYFSDIWVAKLQSEYFAIADIAEKHLKQRPKTPMLAIDWNMGRNWGMWHPQERVIRLNAKLFRDFEWAAVVRVLKHEIAHQIVSEIFDFNANGCHHGEHWKIAAQAVELDNPTRCDAHDFLAGLKGKDESPMADKIRMLLAKGNDNSVTEAESALFLKKAQELMIKHQITTMKVMGSEKFFVKRPVGEHYKRWPHWLWDIGNLLSEFYSVRCIRSHTYVEGKGLRYYLELFGEPENVNLAEYVFYAIINNGRILFEQALKEHREKFKNDQNYKAMNSRWSYNSGKTRCSKFTEASFMRGLISGFKGKLYGERSAVKESLDKETRDTYAVVSTSNEKLLQEMYDDTYHPRMSGGTRYTGAGGNAGRAAGANFRLNHGVSSSGYKGNLLCA